MAKGKLSKVEKFYIAQKYAEGISVKEIAEDLGRSIDVVTKYCTPTTAAVDNKEVSSPIPESVSEQISLKKLLNRRTASGKKGVVAMTPNASSWTDPDIVNGRTVSKNKTADSERNKNSICPIHNDE